ncbi:MAG: hypothetical protein IKU57_03075 [Oscillospiraceae bacterium]|nr:hypothetical protein [Oscillospiraceae bacterium]
MKKRENKTTKIFNITLAVLMVAFMVVMFVMPFKTYEALRNWDPVYETGTREIVTVSLGEYVWFPRDYADMYQGEEWETKKAPNGELLGNLVDDDGNDFFQSQIVEMPFMATLMCAAGLLFCLWKNEQKWCALFPALAGGFMLFGLLTSYILKAGESWLVLVITAAVLLAASIWPLIRWFVDIYKWFTVKKRHY